MKSVTVHLGENEAVCFPDSAYTIRSDISGRSTDLLISQKGETVGHFPEGSWRYLTVKPEENA